MFDFITVSEVTIVGVVGVVVVGGWVAIAFYRSHRAFNAREQLHKKKLAETLTLYHLHEAIKRGEQVSPSELQTLQGRDDKNSVF